MAITASSRARTALHASTVLNPAEALEIVKQAAEQVKEHGVISKAEVRVRVRAEQPGHLALMIGAKAGKKSMVTFTAEAESVEGGTAVRVGGLETYKTFQTKALGLIPSGPASILGFGLYKKFLREVASRLKSQDPTATVSVGVPSP